VLLEAVNHAVDEKTFQFFSPPPKTGTLTGTSIFPEAKKSVFWNRIPIFL
jgi:hypothetical protein